MIFQPAEFRQSEEEIEDLPKALRIPDRTAGAAPDHGFSTEGTAPRVGRVPRRRDQPVLHVPGAAGVAPGRETGFLIRAGMKTASSVGERGLDDGIEAVVEVGGVDALGPSALGLEGPGAAAVVPADDDRSGDRVGDAGDMRVVARVALGDERADVRRRAGLAFDRPPPNAGGVLLLDEHVQRRAAFRPAEARPIHGAVELVRRHGLALRDERAEHRLAVLEDEDRDLGQKVEVVRQAAREPVGRHQGAARGIRGIAGCATGDATRCGCRQWAPRCRLEGRARGRGRRRAHPAIHSKAAHQLGGRRRGSPHARANGEPAARSDRRGRAPRAEPRTDIADVTSELGRSRRVPAGIRRPLEPSGPWEAGPRAAHAPPGNGRSRVPPARHDGPDHDHRRPDRSRQSRRRSMPARAPSPPRRRPSS